MHDITIIIIAFYLSEVRSMPTNVILFPKIKD